MHTSLPEQVNIVLVQYILWLLRMKKESQLRGIQPLGQFYLKEKFSYACFPLTQIYVVTWYIQSFFSPKTTTYQWFLLHMWQDLTLLSIFPMLTWKQVTTFCNFLYLYPKSIKWKHDLIMPLKQVASCQHHESCQNISRNKVFQRRWYQKTLKERERKLEVTEKKKPSQRKAIIRFQWYTSEVLYIKVGSHWIGVFYR